MSASRWHPRFDTWAASDPTVLDRKWVHKRDDANVLVARVERGDAPDTFLSELRIPRDHAFFFEHEVDHVPGLALIEAGRQVGVAVSHRFYDVQLDGFVFLIRELNATFSAFADLEAPVFGNSVVSDVVVKHGRTARMSYTGHYLQHGRSIGTLTGTWAIVPAGVTQRLRRESR